MALWQTGMRKERLKMIEAAMLETSPKVHHHIKEVEKTMPEFLDLTEKAMMSEFWHETDRMEEEVARKDLPPLKQVQEITMRIRMIWEVALANHLEFPESLYLPESETSEYLQEA